MYFSISTMQSVFIILLFYMNAPKLVVCNIKASMKIFFCVLLWIFVVSNMLYFKFQDAFICVWLAGCVCVCVSVYVRAVCVCMCVWGGMCFCLCVKAIALSTLVICCWPQPGTSLTTAFTHGPMSPKGVRNEIMMSYA